jgi:hypothetical protein
MVDSTSGLVPGRLLAHLYLKGLVRQPEVAVTEAITWLCALPGGSHALDQLIRDAGLDPEPEVAWYAEVPAADRSRTDIEAWWGDPPLPRVVIEAKLGHTLTVEQVAIYFAHLKTRLADHDRSDEGVVVLLVPEHRSQEARAVLSKVEAAEVEAAKSPLLRTAVWNYRQVLDALEEALGADGDVAQLRGLVEICEALDIKPLSPEDLTMASSPRAADLRRVVDFASVSLFDETRILPSGSDEHFTWRRYHQVVGDTHVAIGLRRPEASADASAHGRTWMRVHATTPEAALAGEALKQQCPSAYTDAAGHVWVPLEVPVGVSGSGMITRVAEQVEAVIAAIRAALSRSDTESDRLSDRGAGLRQ